VSLLLGPQGVVVKLYVGRVTEDDLTALQKDYLQ
jgi:hypothetical protein